MQMKGQWSLILSLVFALIVAVFAVINVEPVTVDYLFGTSEWPLILVILGSALLGGLAVGSIGIVRVYRLQRKIKLCENEKNRLGEEMERLNEPDKSKETVQAAEEDEPESEDGETPKNMKP